MKKIGKYLVGIILFLFGIVVIVWEEPVYGIGIIILSLLCIPLFSAMITKLFPNLFSFRVKAGICVGIILTIMASMSLFGRKDFGKVENVNKETLKSLSTHHISKRVINDLDYYFIERGQGETILLLHGFPDMANTWDETIEELSKTNHVVAPFLRGYYPTSIPKDDDYSVKTIAEDMIALIDELKVDTFTVIGQDWGASISFAIENLVPSRVEHLVSISIPHPSCLEVTPQLFFAGRHFFLLGLTDNYGARYTRKNDFEYIDRLYKRWSPDYKEYKTSSEAIKETFKFPNRTEAALGYYRSFAAEQGLPERDKFYRSLPETPVLFLLGENDLIYNKEIIGAMNKKMPQGSKTVVFENAGHFLHREVFSSFLSELNSFLN